MTIHEAQGQTYGEVVYPDRVSHALFLPNWSNFKNAEIHIYTLVTKRIRLKNRVSNSMNNENL